MFGNRVDKSNQFQSTFLMTKWVIFNRHLIRISFPRKILVIFPLQNLQHFFIDFNNSVCLIKCITLHCYLLLPKLHPQTFWCATKRLHRSLIHPFHLSLHLSLIACPLSSAAQSIHILFIPALQVLFALPQLLSRCFYFSLIRFSVSPVLIGLIKQSVFIYVFQIYFSFLLSSFLRLAFIQLLLHWILESLTFPTFPFFYILLFLSILQ